MTTIPDDLCDLSDMFHNGKYLMAVARMLYHDNPRFRAIVRMLADCMRTSEITAAEVLAALPMAEEYRQQEELTLMMRTVKPLKMGPVAKGEEG